MNLPLHYIQLSTPQSLTQLQSTNQITQPHPMTVSNPIDKIENQLASLSDLRQLRTGLGYHLLGTIPSYQHKCPPLSVATNLIFLFSSISSCGMAWQLTMGSSLDTINRVFTFNCLICSPLMAYCSNKQSGPEQPRILAVMLPWNSLRLVDRSTSFRSTRPMSCQYFISGCRLTVSQMYLLTKNLWQMGDMSSTTFLTSKGGARATSPAILGRLLLTRYLIRQLPPKLVPTKQMGERGYSDSTRSRAKLSQLYSRAVKGMGLLMSVLIPRLFRHTHWYPSLVASSVRARMQFISLPPVSPCITNKTGGAVAGHFRGLQSKAIWPPSSKNIFSRSQVTGILGSARLYTDCRKGCDRKVVGWKWNPSCLPCPAYWFRPVWKNLPSCLSCDSFIQNKQLYNSLYLCTFTIQQILFAWLGGFIGSSPAIVQEETKVAVIENTGDQLSGAEFSF